MVTPSLKYHFRHIHEMTFCKHVSRKPQYKDVYKRTIEMPQRARIFMVNWCLNVHNAHLKLLSPISG